VAEKPKNDAPPEEEIEGEIEGEAEGGDEAKKGRKLPSKKLIVMIAGPLLLLLLGGAGAYLLGFISPGGDSTATAENHVPKKPEKTVFYDLPELLVNLNSAGRRTNFLKISVSLEVASEADIPKLEAVKPRIIDSFQVYLRELRLDDLKGSAGVLRLKEELLRRVNVAAAPYKVRDVLLKEMIVQ